MICVRCGRDGAAGFESIDWPVGDRVLQTPVCAAQEACRARLEHAPHDAQGREVATMERLRIWRSGRSKRCATSTARPQLELELAA